MKDLNSIVEEINGNKVVDSDKLYNLLGLSGGTSRASVDWFHRRKQDAKMIEGRNYLDKHFGGTGDRKAHYFTLPTAKMVMWVEEEHKKGYSGYKKLFKIYKQKSVKDSDTDIQPERVAEVSHKSNLTDIKSKSLDPVLEVGYNVLQEYHRTSDSSYKQMLKDFMNMMTKNQSQTTVADEGIKLP